MPAVEPYGGPPDVRSHRGGEDEELGCMAFWYRCISARAVKIHVKIPNDSVDAVGYTRRFIPNSLSEDTYPAYGTSTPNLSRSRRDRLSERRGFWDEANIYPIKILFLTPRDSPAHSPSQSGHRSSRYTLVLRWLLQCFVKASYVPRQPQRSLWAVRRGNPDGYVENVGDEKNVADMEDVGDGAGMRMYETEKMQGIANQDVVDDADRVPHPSSILCPLLHNIPVCTSLVSWSCVSSAIIIARH
ncbi:hypothetical protein BDQ17DRAFT_1335246 [Cyathus striatus]|nr:hypothetical protein BDQ17DRAFT_1335246 [Cyathus striatus]